LELEDEERQWKAAAGALASLIEQMKQGARPALSPELSLLAMQAVESAQASEKQSLDAWAKVLALDVADIHD
jgi:hypothetical protein